ncbi:DUF3850 domain-containing protein [Anaerosporobacter sp.]
MLHQLKTTAEYFLDVASGKKTFEVRKNDRDFCVGDFIGLNELTNKPVNNKDDYKETGRFILAEVTYVLNDINYVKDGYVVLGIKPCTITKEELKEYEVFD